jgi:hypothetical protein
MINLQRSGAFDVEISFLIIILIPIDYLIERIRIKIFLGGKTPYLSTISPNQPPPTIRKTSFLTGGRTRAKSRVWNIHLRAKPPSRRLPFVGSTALEWGNAAWRNHGAYCTRMAINGTGRDVRPSGVDQGAYNKVNFQPVKTTGLRREVQMRSGWSAGIQEWTVP